MTARSHPRNLILDGFGLPLQSDAYAQTNEDDDELLEHGHDQHDGDGASIELEPRLIRERGQGGIEEAHEEEGNGNGNGKDKTPFPQRDVRNTEPDGEKKKAETGPSEEEQAYAGFGQSFDLGWVTRAAAIDAADYAENGGHNNEGAEQPEKQRM